MSLSLRRWETLADHAWMLLFHLHRDYLTGVLCASFAAPELVEATAARRAVGGADLERPVPVVVDVAQGVKCGVVVDVPAQRRRAQPDEAAPNPPDLLGIAQ